MSTYPVPREFRLISLSGGGYRAALFNAGSLRALHSAELLFGDVIVNSVSGGSLPTILWRKYLASLYDAPADWPETSLLDLVTRTPKLGGQLNWQLRGAWFGATKAWLAFLEQWWDGLDYRRDRTGDEPQFLIEALDYHSGELWLYDCDIFAQATRDFIKTRLPFMHCRVSEMKAVAVATAFPLAFQGVSISGGKDPTNTSRLQDAGLIDNVAMMPLLQIIRHDSAGKSLGNVAQWIVSDAGKPLPVTSPQLYTVGPTRVVNKLGILDKIFRLTGDLAQPHMVNLIAGILADYARIDFIGIAIGLSIEDDEPWLPIAEGNAAPAGMATMLGFVPRELALNVMVEGAQSMCKALLGRRLMTARQQQEVREFFIELIS